MSELVGFGMKYRRDRHLRTILKPDIADQFPLDVDDRRTLVASFIKTLGLLGVLEDLYFDMAKRGRFRGDHPVSDDPNGLYVVRTVLDAERDTRDLLGTLIRRRPPPCREPLNLA